MEIIQLKDITFAYPQRQPVFESVNFCFKKGERLGIMGPNGTGKTTLLHIIMGLLKPLKGEVIIFGKRRQTETDFQEVRRRIGLLFQDPDDQLFCPTVEEEIAFGLLNFGKSRSEIRLIIKEVLQLVGLNGFEQRVTYKLSGGEKRLVALAAVLAMKPEVLLMDEPTGDLDPQNMQRLIQVINKMPLSYIIVSHDERFLKQVTDKIYWFENGRFEPVTDGHH